VLDVSFIGLKNIIDTVVSFGHNATEYFLLIKPQFEVGFGNTKKGIVRDLEKVNDILLSYTRLLKEKGFAIVTIDPCVIEGGDGNQEYFAYCSNRS
jgi:23S rRNA (cytidine1920-2'-O)/16S rRNA (cytidine1409-2'-O)-methyltransferase